MNIEADAEASEQLDFFAIHGYDEDGVQSAGESPRLWNWWVDGWTDSPAAGIPAGIRGFVSYGKKSWMTETSGETAPWLNPDQGFPGSGWSVEVPGYGVVTLTSDVHLATSSGPDEVPGEASATGLLGVYPQPADRHVHVAYRLEQGTPVRMELHDVAGRRLRVIADAPMPAGTHEVDFSTEGLGSGVVLVTFAAGGVRQTRSVVIAPGAR